jgi:putative transposase
MSEDDGLKAMGQAIQIDEARIRDHLGEMVRGTVEEALNALLNAEADRLWGAGHYECSQGRQDTRAGSYERSLHTMAGEVNLKVPKLRRQTFETAIIERYRRRESSVEELLMLRGDLTSGRRERAGDCVRFLVDDHQQDTRCSIRMTSILFPIA